MQSTSSSRDLIRHRRYRNRDNNDEVLVEFPKNKAVSTVASNNKNTKNDNQQYTCNPGRRNSGAAGVVLVGFPDKKAKKKVAPLLFTAKKREQAKQKQTFCPVTSAESMQKLAKSLSSKNQERRRRRRRKFKSKRHQGKEGRKERRSSDTSFGPFGNAFENVSSSAEFELFKKEKQKSKKNNFLMMTNVQYLGAAAHARVIAEKLAELMTLETTGQMPSQDAKDFVQDEYVRPSGASDDDDSVTGEMSNKVLESEEDKKSKELMEGLDFFAPGLRKELIRSVHAANDYNVDHIDELVSKCMETSTKIVEQQEEEAAASIIPLSTVEEEVKRLKCFVGDSNLHNILKKAVESMDMVNIHEVSSSSDSDSGSSSSSDGDFSSDSDDSYSDYDDEDDIDEEPYLRMLGMER